MRKIAIFTEGKGELIFVRDMLLKLIDNSKLSFSCMEVYAKEMRPTRYKYRSPNAEVFFLIVNVGNDETVISAIKERETYLMRNNFERIIGLKDMYSERYRQESPGKINDRITRKFIDGADSTIKEMQNHPKITLYFAIMELEAWFLGMHNVFNKIYPRLTVDFIEKKLGYNLAIIDPQKKFFQPAKDIDEIFKLVSSRYKKKGDDVEGIVSKVETGDFSDAMKNGRCQSFRDFYGEIIKYQ